MTRREQSKSMTIFFFFGLLFRLLKQDDIYFHLKVSKDVILNGVLRTFCPEVKLLLLDSPQKQQV